MRERTDRERLMSREIAVERERRRDPHGAGGIHTEQVGPNR